MEKPDRERISEARADLQKQVRNALPVLLHMIALLRPPKLAERIRHSWSCMLTLVNELLDQPGPPVPLSGYETPSQLCAVMGVAPLTQIPPVWTPVTWGPPYWDFLHAASLLVHTQAQVTQFAVMMVNFGTLLVCNICEAHYNANDAPKVLAREMITTQDVVWPLFALHNRVNTSIDKTPMTCEAFRLKYKLAHPVGTQGDKDHA